LKSCQGFVFDDVVDNEKRPVIQQHGGNGGVCHRQTQEDAQNPVGIPGYLFTSTPNPGILDPWGFWVKIASFYVSETS